MFGYVRIFKPELKCLEYEQYEGVYCSLCRRMGKRYGHATRMTLSYDFTFLALLRMGLSPACPGFHEGRCPYNPFKKRMCCGGAHGENESVDFAADAAALLLHYNLLDKAHDHGFWKQAGARVLLLLTGRGFRKAQREQPVLDRHIADCIMRQGELERAHTASLDAAAEPSAQMLQALAEAAGKNEAECAALRRLGYCLGRWVYLTDAADDLAEDVRRGDYNPFALVRGVTAGDAAAVAAAKAYALPVLNACLAECIEAYEQMTILRFDGILRNILTMGMPRAIAQAAGQKGNDACEQSI